MTLSPSVKLDQLLETYPFLLEYVAGLSPKFGKVRNPILRKTVGKLATLDQVARMGDLPVRRLLEAIAAEITRVTHATVRVEAGDGGEARIARKRP